MNLILCRTTVIYSRMVYYIQSIEDDIGQYIRSTRRPI